MDRNLEHMSRVGSLMTSLTYTIHGLLYIRTELLSNFLADLPTMVIWVVEVPREGYKIKIDFWLEINIQEENHCIL